MVKNLSSNEDDIGSMPGQETKILQAARQLSPCTQTTELVHSRAHAPQLEKARLLTTTKTWGSQKQHQTNKQKNSLMGS